MQLKTNLNMSTIIIPITSQKLIKVNISIMIDPIITSSVNSNLIFHSYIEF
jgi:hydroxymethylpyrimidine/phosphomethylpyrimidine kinase